MRKAIINTLAAAALIAGIAASVLAPWWAVLFLCIPAAWAGAVTLLSVNSNHINQY